VNDLEGFRSYQSPFMETAVSGVYHRYQDHSSWVSFREEYATTGDPRSLKWMLEHVTMDNPPLAEPVGEVRELVRQNREINKRMINMSAYLVIIISAFVLGGFIGGPLTVIWLFMAFAILCGILYTSCR
jgi:hypothetical protein